MPTEYVSTVMDSFLYPDREEPRVLGDGTDETSKLQTHINNASAQGRIVILPPFTIKVTTISLPVAGVQIWGQSGISGQPLSELLSTGINAPIVQTTGNTRAMWLRGFKITGTSVGANQHGIELNGNQSALFRLQDLHIRLCGGDGLHIDNPDYSFVLDSIYSSANEGHQFWIDSANAPCVMLFNCYAGVVKTNKYGFYLRRGNYELVNCNSLDGGTPPHSCVAVGESAVGTALAVFRNCNFESFGLYGIISDIGSDVRLYNCAFVAPSSGTVQPLYLIQPGGRSFIDEATSFVTGGAAYDNAAGLPIKIFDRGINAPAGYGYITQRGLTYFNSEDGRVEPLQNLDNRLACASVITTSTFTQTRPCNYIPVNRAGAVTVTLIDPQNIHLLEGHIVVIKDESGNASTNNITVNTVNSRNINGSTSTVISTNYGSVRLIKRNNQYWII